MCVVYISAQTEAFSNSFTVLWVNRHINTHKLVGEFTAKEFTSTKRTIIRQTYYFMFLKDGMVYSSGKANIFEAVVTGHVWLIDES